MSKVILTVVIALGIAMALNSCKKYDNGGSIKKAETNILNSWKFESYFQDGIDKTADLLISNYRETYSSGGILTRSYTDASGDQQSQEGTYSFDSEKKTISVSGVGSIELTAESSTVSTSEFDILKLKEDAFWYSYENGGNTHEFHLVP